MLSKLSRRRGLQLEALGSVLICTVMLGRSVSVYLAGWLCPNHSHHFRRAADDRHPRGQAARRRKSELILRAFLIPKPPDFTPLLGKGLRWQAFSVSPPPFRSIYYISRSS